tara:strand:+ start:26415 stop:26624 length:210 start_codon:yes stop_codon:yes gene_type:complete
MLKRKQRFKQPIILTDNRKLYFGKEDQNLERTNDELLHTKNFILMDKTDTTKASITSKQNSCKPIDCRH